MAQIRKLAPDEWPTLREARLKALKESPLSFGRTYEYEIQLADTEWQERAAEWACYVAADRNEIVGLAAGATFEAGSPELHGMWVAPSHRGTGLGGELAEEVIRWARTLGAKQVVLHTAEDNDQAIRFYERLGFERTGAAIRMGSRPEVLAPELAMKL